jgi:hypothetical protein
MIPKIKSWWHSRRLNHNKIATSPDSFTREQLVNAYKLGYNDGKRDGLTVAREQATKSLREILKTQNQKH